jgi:pilus assembly protein FimV
MVAKSVKWALASLVIALPSAAFAVGLGDVRLLSSLNAPLDAEIELVGATPEEMAVIKAQLASRELFARNGLDWPTGVGSISITPQTKPDGKAVLRMRSTQAVTDPFLTLLVEVDALRTHTVREYTLLLDPPVFAPGEQQNAPVAAPSTGAGTREGAIARQTAPAPARPAAEPAAPAASRPSPSASAPSRSVSSAAEGGERTVRPGDTLSGIASEVASDASQSRAWMLAIYQNNPSAFDGNMNVLRSGAVLRIPNASAVASIAPGEANAEIRRQYASWRGSAAPAPSASEPGRLRLVAPGAPGGATAPSSAQGDPALQGRVRELEAQLQESRRLLEARNAELAQLQARLANQPAAAPAATPPPAAAPTPPPAAQAPAETPPPAEATPPAAEATPPPAEEPAAQQAPPAAQEAQPAPPVKRPAPAAAAEESGGSIFDTLKQYWWALAGLVVVILALFGVKAIRSRKQNDFDDSLSRLQGAAAGAEALSRDSSGDTQPLRAAQNRESAFVVEESGTHERPRFSSGNDFAPATAPRNVAADETISSETAINLDQGDPLAEADFHMAYGLYDQAADLVRIAISREPGRRDLKLKLLEVFFVWGNKDQFLQTAHELAETRDRAAPGEWEKIVIMGKQLAPEDPLFAGAGGSAGLGGMDLDLEGGQDRVDFDILGEPASQAQSADGIDLDIGSALGDSNDGSGATVTDANLALHEDGFTPDDASTGITREMTQNLRGDNSPTVQQYGADLESPTVEQPGLYGGNPTLKQKVESAMKQGGMAEQTAELAIDDLGLDLGALDDSPNLNSTQEAPTLVAGLDERSRRIMDEAERRGGLKDMDATAIASTGAWNLNGEDLEQTMPPQQIGGYSNGEGSETSRLQALKGGDNDLDFNFNDEEPSAPAARGGYTNGSGAAPDIDLDVGTATVPDTAFTATQKLSSEDLALPDLEPVTMSEVGTKLDLARAYMDMGDPEGARNILEEVMTEGSLAQKQEAQRLMESLPG